MFGAIGKWLIGNGLSNESAIAIETTIAMIFLGVAALIAWLVTVRIVVPLVLRAARQTKTNWDDILAEHGLFHKLSRLIPVLVLYVGIDFVFPRQEHLVVLFQRLLTAVFVVVSVLVFNALLSGTQHIYNTYEISRNKPIRGYIQALKIIISLCGAIWVVSVLMGKSPWGILSVFGGLTAVVILIFKDTILGFVAGIQLSAHDMVRVGDWIEMPKYGADGDVIDISINTVKIRNWDKTIASIPTYALVSDSFKNWRGMQESGGRRIKRALYIDMHSITFCDEQMRQRFHNISLLKEYLGNKEAEIDRYNREHNIDTSNPLNGRRQTNIGVFRAYCVAYLRNHPQIRNDMTFLVRHLEPTPQGLPLQIYVFSKDQVWANYEAIQADIFDHLLAALPQFGLRSFQYPTGYDFRVKDAPAPAL